MREGTLIPVTSLLGSFVFCDSGSSDNGEGALSSRRSGGCVYPSWLVFSVSNIIGLTR